MKKKRLLIVLVPIYIIAIIVLFIFLTIKDNEKEDKISKEYFEKSSIYLKGSIYDYKYYGNHSLLFIDVDSISYKNENFQNYIGIYDTIKNKAVVLTGFTYPGLVDGKKISKDSLPDIEINYKTRRITFISENYNDSINISVSTIVFYKIKDLKCYNCIEF
jgi:hypothetical protein|nr:hypothetical protein [uncultured Flavobacterium sp.]